MYPISIINHVQVLETATDCHVQHCTNPACLQLQPPQPQLLTMAMQATRVMNIGLYH